MLVVVMARSMVLLLYQRSYQTAMGTIVVSVGGTWARVMRSGSGETNDLKGLAKLPA
jgi:hypothetical protein